MSNHKTLTQKEKELIATGASVAAGCQPCTAHHFKAVRDAGATEEEISQAVADALCVRNSATRVLKELTEQLLGNGPTTEESCCSSKPLIGELVSIGASFAVNCTTNMATHLEKAQAVGATEQQIKVAIGIARSIQVVAGQKVEKLIGTDTAPEKKSSDDDYGCNTLIPEEEGRGDDCGCNEG